MPETLRQYLSRGPIEPSKAVNILRQLLETLAFDHWRGLVHGDIAPETIMLAPGSRPWLAGAHPSFSDKLTVLPGEDLDESGAGVATRSAAPPGDLPGDAQPATLYAAPEQLNGAPADEGSDFFAVAVVAYEMFTGRHPFGASDGLPAAAVAERILHTPPYDIPAETLSRLPVPVLAVLDTALSKDPRDRFASAIDFIEALEQAKAAASSPPEQPAPENLPATEVNGDRVETAAPTEATPTKAAPRRALKRRLNVSWRPWLAGSAVVVVAVIAVAVYLLMGHEGGSVFGGSTTLTSQSGPSTVASPLVADTTLPATSTTTTLAPTTTTAAPTTSSTTTSSTTTTLALVRVEQTDERLVYTGDWTTVTNDSASGRNFSFCDERGASVTIAFEGTYLAWITKRSPDYGIAEVTLDGRELGTIDLYAPSAGWQLKVWGSGNLQPGRHVVTITRTGTKNAAATDTNIGVDAFDVRGSLVPVVQ